MNVMNGDESEMGKIQRIIMFKGDIETTAYFSMQMEKTFHELGYETFFYDYRDVAKSVKELLLFLRKGSTAVVTFNYHGLCGDSEVFYDKEQGGYIWNDFDVPCINIVVDHPFYYHRFFENLPKRYIHVSIDKNHEKYMEEYFPAIERGPFLPLGGTSLAPKGNYKPISERSMDIVFTGNYVRPENFCVYIERAGEEYTQFYMGILEELKKDPSRLLEDVAREHIIKEIPDVTHDEIGNGWEELECVRKENILIGGSLDSLGCLEKIADGKISLNVMPWFKAGSHDRIFNSMLNGAVCLTDSSDYLDEYLRHGENALVYDLKNLEELPELAEKFLGNPEKMQAVADAGFQMAGKYHTWKDRAMEIHRLLQTMN